MLCFHLEVPVAKPRKSSSDGSSLKGLKKGVHSHCHHLKGSLSLVNTKANSPLYDTGACILGRTIICGFTSYCLSPTQSPICCAKQVSIVTDNTADDVAAGIDQIQDHLEVINGIFDDHMLCGPEVFYLVGNLFSKTPLILKRRGLPTRFEELWARNPTLRKGGLVRGTAVEVTVNQ